MFLLHLSEHGIEEQIYTPILMAYHTAYKDRFIGLSFPVTERLIKEILSLPNHDQMTDKQVDCVTSTVCKFLEKNREEHNSET